MSRPDQPAAVSERQEFAHRVHQYQHSLFGYLARLGLSDSAIDDVAQEAFLRAWRYRDRYDASRSQWNTWLFRIARNLAFTAMQRAQKTEPTEPQLLERSVVDDASPERVAIGNQKRLRLRQALKMLNDKERDALAIAYVEGISGDAAAKMLGCEAGTFRTRVSRARSRLTALLESKK